jgi:multimeric flavodoxin WrbA
LPGRSKETHRMKVVGIVGSPRKKGNTEFLVNHTLKAIAEEGLESELITLAGLDIRPCTACMACQKEERCSIDDDLFPIYLKMKEADGIIIASPVYYGSATSLVKALMERAGFIGRFNGEVFSRKVGGPIAVARRAGQNFTLAQLTFWFQILGFFIPGSSYWNMAVGRERGEVERDEEGLTTVWNFGKNMAFLIKKTRG